VRCLRCERWAFSHLCRDCRRALSPSLHRRKILGNIPVYAFYRYDEIEPLLLEKHGDTGYHLYRILSELSFAPYAKTLELDVPTALIGVDDHVRHGYAHTALLVRSMKHPRLRARYGVLRARSKMRYSGKDFAFRLRHPRRFELKDFPETQVILVDDILTTGLTLTQAAETLTGAGKEVLCCLVLASVDKEK